MKISRRSFTVGALCAGLSGCNLENLLRKNPQIKIYGPESDRGHIVRDGSFLNLPVERKQDLYQTIILGGGVSGLTALKHLYDEGIKDILLLELGSQVGGNARAGVHKYGEHPWGAHYLPLPNQDNQELIKFLHQAQAITDFDKEGRPYYNEEFLIHAPESRLYRYGTWQNGIFPNFKTAELGESQKQEFYKLLANYKNFKTNDGLPSFNIPIANSSKDSRLLSLDNITGKDFLVSNGITDSRVHWYCDYATRDDYGTALKDVSAWALLHYFLARESYKANESEQDILTWPEGNNWLVRKLLTGLERYIETDQVVISVFKEGSNFVVRSLSVKESTIVERRTQSIICSLPEFAAKRILAHDLLEVLPPSGEYNPWVVSNLILRSDETSQMPWDSVSYHSNSLGFVKAGHQDLNKNGKGAILTHYNALVDSDSKSMRHDLYSSSEEELAGTAILDLKSMYPKLVPEIEEVRLWIWAHAMRKVGVGSMEDPIVVGTKNSDQGIYYAHTDKSGISIFEEAFYQGNKAGKNCVQFLKT